MFVMKTYGKYFDREMMVLLLLIQLWRIDSLNSFLKFSTMENIV